MREKRFRWTRFSRRVRGCRTRLIGEGDTTQVCGRQNLRHVALATTIDLMATSHDHDAGGAPETLAAKQELREHVWARLTDEKQARFPGARNRIPNFVGAEKAADRLRETEAWAAARTIKCNPDSAQWPVRQRALEDGKTVYMAVPRLADPNPFFLLDPDDLGDRTPRQASSIKGATAAGRTVAVEDLEPVDLVVAGCVAVTADGARLGKGGGFSDLEFAVAFAAGLVTTTTPVVTTVHELQVVDAIPTVDHDVTLDLIVTPERVHESRHEPRHEPAIVWAELTDEKIDSIPLLASRSRMRMAR